MIKYFQKLKAKKGFTLVELIVVIAIIGVLAAILIPTMLGYVTSSRVTSADSTAASLRDSVNAYITQRDTEGKGIKRVNSDLTIKLTFANGACTPLTDSGLLSASATQADFDGKLKSKLEDDYDIKDAYAEVYIRNGKAVACCFANGTYTALPSGSPGAANFAGSTYIWDSTDGGATGTAGITSSGEIVGTSPKLQLGASTTTGGGSTGGGSTGGGSTGGSGT